MEGRVEGPQQQPERDPDPGRCEETLFGRDRCELAVGHEGFHEAVSRYTNGLGHDVVEEISWGGIA